MQVAFASEMQQLDRAAIEEYHIPGIVLMENAGRGTVDLMIGELGAAAGKEAVIFVGPGNNGGDGLVIARRLHQLGGLPEIVYLVDPQSLKGDAAANRFIVEDLKLPSQILLDGQTLEDFVGRYTGEKSRTRPWAVVDAVFGTGLQRPLSGHFKTAVDCMNRLRGETCCPVVAVDIPSGLNADTGEVMGASVQADHTVTYGLAKPGHYLHGGGSCGRIHVVDIGIPPAAVRNAGLKGSALTGNVLDIFKERHPSSHKGNYGHLLILAGSAGKTGAAFLSALGALRSGTGLVTLAVPADLRTVFESNLFEAMTLLLADSRRYPSIADFSLIADNLRGKSALVIGPGIGTADKTRKLVVKLYREAELPIVMDADGLNILALESDAIVDPPAPRILTPHPGEMGRLTGMNSADIQKDRLSAALDFTTNVNKATKRITTILKGAGTIVCSPDGTWSINTSGNPGMAAGGMGDVLSGLIGGLVAQGFAIDAAVRAGVYLHGAAADRLAIARRFGYLASEVADMLPFIIGGHR